MGTQTLPFAKPSKVHSPAATTKGTALPGIAQGPTAQETNAGVVSVPNLGPADSDVGAALMDVGQKLQDAQNKIILRKEGIERMRDMRAFRKEASELVTAQKDTQDWSDPDAASNVSDMIENLMRDRIANHKGGEDSRLSLMQDMTTVFNKHVDDLSLTGATAQDAMQEEELDGALSEAQMFLRTRRGNFEGLVAGLAKRVDDLPAMSPDQKQARKLKDFGQMGLVAVDELIKAGDLASLNDAEDVLISISRAIGSDERKTYVDRINKARNPDIKTKLIGDPTSPTGSRIVLEEDAVNKPGPPKAPLMVNNPPTAHDVLTESTAAALGKADAKTIEEYEERGQQAIRDGFEIDRITAAIKGGKFTTGVFSDARHFLAQFSEMAGIDTSALKDGQGRPLLGDAMTADTIDAAVNRLAVVAAQKLGRITNMSLEFIRKSLPGLMRTDQGNLILLEVMTKVKEREILVADMSSNFFRKHGTLRPKDAPSFFQEVKDLDDSDPVIDDDLKQRIEEGGKLSATSMSDRIKATAAAITKVPAAVEGLIPEGYNFKKVQDGLLFIEKGGKEFSMPMPLVGKDADITEDAPPDEAPNKKTTKKKGS